jgi:hypothetical protein
MYQVIGSWFVVHVDEDVGAENQKLKSFDSPDSDVGAGNNVVPKIVPVVLYVFSFKQGSLLDIFIVPYVYEYE